MIGVITEDNFFFNGTLKENISWNVHNFDEFQADLFAQELQIEEDLENYKEHGLDSKIASVEGAVNSELNKKIALLRILCLKPKIVIIKDTPSFLGERSIVQIIENHIPDCTIIKISKQIEVSFDMDRIVRMENLKIIEEGYKNDLINMSVSGIGKMLRESNIDNYLYSNMASVSPRKYKSRASMIGFG
jgi:ABC-type bacteriocin/lantibiotic exporter with double-glycine peptidase domain